MRLVKERKAELNELTEHYKLETGEIQLHPQIVAHWLREKGLADVQRERAEKMLAAELAVAWQNKTTTDKDGNEVRTCLCAPCKVPNGSGKEKQELLWADIDDCMSEPGRDFLVRACRRLGEGIMADALSTNRILNYICDKLGQHHIRPIQGFFRCMYDIGSNGSGLSEAGE
jgi:hypothetical protein